MIVLDHSARNVLETCRRKYYFNYERQLEAGRSDAMERGIAAHKVLTIWHSTYNAEKALEAVKLERPERMLPGEEKHYEDLDYAVRELVSGYFKRYGDERKEFKVLTLDRYFSVELAPGWWLVGIVDGLIEEQVLGELVMENKTTSMIMTDWVARLQLDSQTCGYVLLARENGYPNVRGALINVLRTSKYPDYVRDVIMTPDWMPKELREEYLNIFAEIVWRRERQAAGESVWAVWPKTTSACFNYGKECPYRKICLTPPQHREDLIREFYNQRSPREDNILKASLAERSVEDNPS